MQTVFHPGLSDWSDHNPPVVYRIMTPYYKGRISKYSEIIRDIQSVAFLTIPDVTPAVPEGIWADNSRKLGVRKEDVFLAQEDSEANTIGPARVGDSGRGMSVVPVLAPALLPHHRVPIRNGGTGSNVDCWFKLSRDVIANSPDLRLYFDTGEETGLVKHGVIEPGVVMPPATFSQSLKETRSSWICIYH